VIDLGEKHWEALRWHFKRKGGHPEIQGWYCYDILFLISLPKTELERRIGFPLNNIKNVLVANGRRK